MKILSRIHYPRLSLLIIISITSYILLYGQPHTQVHQVLLSLNLFGVFFSGVLYAYGFTAPSAALILLSLAKEENIILAGMVGGLGALAGDLMLFFFVRRTFAGEIEQISKNRFFRFVEKEEKRILGRLQKYFLSAFASFLIASPLPTEIGVGLMASRKHLSARKFAVIAYSLHTAGIMVILLIGRAV